MESFKVNVIMGNVKYSIKRVNTIQLDIFCTLANPLPFPELSFIIFYIVSTVQRLYFEGVKH